MDRTDGLRAAAIALALRGRHLLLLDIAVIFVSYIAAFALRFDPPSPLFDAYIGQFAWVLPILLIVRTATFVVFGLYQRVWRFASIAELQAIIGAVAVSSVLAYAAIYAIGAVEPRLAGLPRSIPLVDTLLLLLGIGGARFSLLLFRVGRHRPQSKERAAKALIVGAGGAGAAVARQVGSDRSLGLDLVGFIDDSESKGHRLLGIPVLGTISDLQEVIRTREIKTVLFALPSADGPALRRLVRIAEREGARSLTVPSLAEVVTGRVSSALREVGVDDLLRRAPARIELESVTDAFKGRTVLITGAGGSIGSELARQIAGYGPARMYLLGRGENSIYDVLEMLGKRGDHVQLVPVIADVRDEVAIPRLLRESRPDVVFHAAAHKHVFFMEKYPEEAVSTNVFGTANLLRASEDADVTSFVFVSTDKAVRPTNVMGATKRIGELMVRDAARRTGRRYVAVRFGNVLSSRGSVLPRFRRQLADGGPITVSHPQARRYFMTVAEAVQLILQSAVMGRGGETFVLNMGEPVLIEDLARDLIELHGLMPGGDIQITHTGLLPGEKLTEELFFPEEQPRGTSHQDIWAAEDPHASVLTPAVVEDLRAAASTGDQAIIIAAIKRLVPEYTPVSAASARPLVDR